MNELRMKVLKFSDFNRESREHFLDKYINLEIESAVDFLFELHSVDEITEDELYEALNCSKSYAESTPWFVGAAFYEKIENKVQVDEDVLGFLNSMAFTPEGEIVGKLSECVAVDVKFQGIIDNFSYDDLLIILEAFITTDLKALLLGKVGGLIDVSEEYMSKIITKVDNFMNTRCDTEN